MLRRTVMRPRLVQVSAMTRLIFVTQVLNPDDAVVGFIPRFWGARP
jgi:hypothetical protein